MKINNFKKFKIILLNIIFFSLLAPTFAQCYLNSFKSSTGKSQYNNPEVTEYIEIVQNAPPISYSFTASMTCTIVWGSMAILNLNNSSPFRQNIAKINQDFQPTFTEGTAHITVDSPKYKLDGTSNIFTGALTGETSTSVNQSWNVPFKVTFNIPAIQLQSNVFLRPGMADPNGYEAGGYMLRINDTERNPGFKFTLKVGVKPSDMGCSSKAFDTKMNRHFVNFGVLNKTDIEAGKHYQEPFSMTITKKAGHCTYDITPKITFNSMNLLDNKTVDLHNGLVLRLKDADGNEIEFGKPVGKTLIPGNQDQFQIQNKFNAEIQRSPRNDEIINGPFSTTIIYTMEYY